MRLPFLAVMVLVAGVAGCNHSPEGGTTPSNSAGFKLDLPSSTPTKDVKQGDTATLNGSVIRDSGFQKDVKLTVKKPENVDVKVSPDLIKASADTKFTITVSPSKEAALGEKTIEVTGTPDNGGNPITWPFKVKVIAP